MNERYKRLKRPQLKCKYWRNLKSETDKSKLREYENGIE